MANDEGLVALLKDARLVIDYATRAGRLPDDALPQAVTAVEQAGEAVTPPQLAALATALNASVRAIAPITLIELRAGRSPFNLHKQRGLQIFLCVLMFVLTGLVAYYTQLLHQEDTAVKGLQQIQDARPLEKLNAARKMAQIELVLEKEGSQYDQYHRAVEELRDLQDKIFGTYQLAYAVASKASWPFHRPFESSNAPPVPLTENGSEKEAQPFAELKSYAMSVDTDEAIAPGRALTPGSVSGVKEGPQNMGRGRADAGKSADNAKGGDSMPPWLLRVLRDVKDEFDFSTTLGLGLYSNNLLPTSFLTYELQRSMASLNGWLLPLLYGLLGSVVFLMRNMLDPRTANIDFFPSVFRIALGGIAGVVIGWFWVPMPSTSEVAAITSVPFALAFLAGFSIDMMFSLLDRVSRTIAEESGKSTQNKQPET